MRTCGWFWRGKFRESRSTLVWRRPTVGTLEAWLRDETEGPDCYVSGHVGGVMFASKCFERAFFS